jgi:hypothetical protein
MTPQQRDQGERWHVDSIRVKQEYGVSIPAIWEVEMRGWQEQPPPCPGYVVSASLADELRERVERAEERLSKFELADLDRAREAQADSYRADTATDDALNALERAEAAEARVKEQQALLFRLWRMTEPGDVPTRTVHSILHDYLRNEARSLLTPESESAELNPTDHAH